MATMKCPACGDRCEFKYGNGYECPSCGAIYSGEEVSDGINDKLDYANSKRIQDYDFDSALRVCDEILRSHADNQEANWCALLAYYQIVYLQNDEGKYVPTFLNPEVDIPITQHKYYKKLNSSYRIMADNIERMRSEVVHDANSIPDYDVFLSYRQHESRNSDVETEESQWAEDIYRLLTKNKLRVFYDKVTLGKSNAAWEPHIYSALRSAKLMILIGSSISNIESTWVKNEWKRFIAYRNTKGNKTLIVVGGADVDPTRLPDPALRSGQMISVTERGWQDNLARRSADACKETGDMSYMLNEAEVYIQKKKFKKAKKLYQKVIDLDPRNSKAYYGLVRCRYKAFDDYDIVKSRKKLVDVDEFNDAMRYSAGSERKHYEKVRDAQLRHDVKDFNRTNYYAYKRKSKPKRVFAGIGIAVLVLALGAFGVYAYFAISNPVTYKVNGDTVELTGTTFVFDYFVDEVEVNEYKGLPVVKISDDAFKGNKFKTLKVGENVTDIGNSAFENCAQLTTVSIAGNSVNIGNNAFKGCSSLTDVNIGSDAETYYASVDVKEGDGASLGSGAFENCGALANFYITNCNAVGDNAFNGCANMSKMTLGVGDKSLVTENSLAGMNADAEIYVPENAETATELLSSKFAKVKGYARTGIEDCEYAIKKVDFENDVESLDRAAAKYGALNSTQQGYVSNSGDLKDLQSNKTKILKLIQNINNITDDSTFTDLNEINEEYLDLKDSVKKYVYNSDKFKAPLLLSYIKENLEKSSLDNIVLLGSLANDEEYQTLIDAENIYSEEFRNQVEVITFKTTSQKYSVDYWANVFKNIKRVKYDLTSDSSGSSSIRLFPYDIPYEIVGGGKSRSVSIVAMAGSNLDLTLDNVNLSSSGSTIIDLSSMNNAKLTFNGSCNIRGGNSENSVIDAKKLNIVLGNDTKVNVTANGTYAALSANTVDISGGSSSSISVTGGNASGGSSGGNAVSATTLTVTDVIFTATAGNGGYGSSSNGGSSGVAISCTRFNVMSDYVTLVGGNGGTGGKGMKGKNGVTSWKSHSHADKGGKGCKGGNTLFPISEKTIMAYNGHTITVRLGKGGTGGEGGDGGDGGSHTHNGGPILINYYELGNPGQGGEGGDGGDVVMIAYDAAHVKLDSTPSERVGSGGSGGNGGAACKIDGWKGTASNPTKNTQPGSSGSSGSKGSVVEK